MESKIEYSIYDLRAINDPDDAHCYEAGIETKEEAIEAAVSYGGGVVYRETIKLTGYGENGMEQWEVIKSERVEIVEK